MAKSKAAKQDDGISDAALTTVKRIVAQLEDKSEKGTLNKSAYAALRDEAKKATGKNWSDVAGSVERYKP